MVDFALHLSGIDHPSRNRVFFLNRDDSVNQPLQIWGLPKVAVATFPPSQDKKYLCTFHSQHIESNIPCRPHLPADFTCPRLCLIIQLATSLSPGESSKRQSRLLPSFPKTRNTYALSNRSYSRGISWLIRPLRFNPAEYLRR